MRDRATPSAWPRPRSSYLHPPQRHRVPPPAGTHGVTERRARDRRHSYFLPATRDRTIILIGYTPGGARLADSEAEAQAVATTGNVYSQSLPRAARVA